MTFWDFCNTHAGGFEDLAIWILLFSMFVIGAAYKFEWVTSVRSLVCIMITLVLCDIVLDGKVEPKDFLLIVSLIYNFYYVVKNMMAKQGEQK